MITVEDFFQAEIRAGFVVRAERFPEARTPAYRLWIEFSRIS
ncbi:MAG TPA: hypothetical protein VG317_00990 [Pseudonocardiaceae bacterium]|jgi:tRNA-binding protein|nr:hypothetical protein [Pseudonocardiaceae bacterium]